MVSNMPAFQKEIDMTKTQLVISFSSKESAICMEIQIRDLNKPTTAGNLVDQIEEV